jgi:hypothetical protein
VEENVVATQKVSTEDQLADVMTKSLAKLRHWMLCRKAAGME